jgi:transcriptional regulator with XRE-family HTH domain
MPVGEQVRDLRKARGITLQELAGRIGRSVGYVSQIERNKSVISIPVLKEIADALGVNINWFFQGAAQAPAEERDYIVRRGHRRRLEFTGSGLVEELMSPNLTGTFELILGTFEPGGVSGHDKYARPGEVGGYLISGSLRLEIGDKVFTIEPGDAFTYPSSVPHRAVNDGDIEAVVIWAVSPPSY